MTLLLSIIVCIALCWTLAGWLDELERGKALDGTEPYDWATEPTAEEVGQPVKGLEH